MDIDNTERFLTETELNAHNNQIHSLLSSTQRMNDENQENRDPHQAIIEEDEEGETIPLRENQDLNRLFVESFVPNPTVLVPRKTRCYGFRPRGVILRFRDPPQWTRYLVGKAILKEMNFQKYFNRKIDAAYDVTKFHIFKNYSNMVSVIQILTIIILVVYMTLMYSILHNSLETYYFVVTEAVV